VQGDNRQEGQIALRQLNGNFRWQRQEQGWRLDLSRFKLALFDQTVPETGFSLALRQNPEGVLETASAALTSARIDDFRILFDALPLPENKLQPVLRGLAPRGVLKDMRLFYAPERQFSERWAICGAIEGAGVNAWESAPGMDGLNGRMCGNDERGGIVLDAADSHLNAPSLWQKPFPLQRLRVAANWRQSGENWRITATKLDVQAPGMNAKTSFELVLPKSENASAFLDLKTQLSDTDPKLLRDYLPLRAMPQIGRASCRERVS
jgi:uncharacterized protein YhdP